MRGGGWVGTMLAQLYRWPNPVGHGHYAHPIWMGARGWALRAHNGGWVPLERHLFGREGGVPTVQVALEGCTHHQLCSWVWLGQATQWWVGPSDTT